MSLVVLGSLHDGNTANECSVKMLDTNEDVIEYDILVTRENFNLGKSEPIYLLRNKHTLLKILVHFFEPTTGSNFITPNLGYI